MLSYRRYPKTLTIEYILNVCNMINRLPVNNRISMYLRISMLIIGSTRPDYNKISILTFLDYMMVHESKTITNNMVHKGLVQ